MWSSTAMVTGRMEGGRASSGSPIERMGSSYLQDRLAAGTEPGLDRRGHRCPQCRSEYPQADLGVTVMDLIQANAPITTSSREIAELFECRHDNVKRTIDRLAF
ncbi:hypothetical protein IQ22_03718 [Pseudomonas duriflava]|uniref:Uncharacterized protein n=1 Tax=Pseudomonas duriflava TaxID=459528 RepID=A0A562Q4S2_9PSED|nr:hypothetical protein [Pseudomonas duriflava]TWI51016.1 hypothetical protein IQ22_03718 [Pseudomonas duriflava]